MWQLLYIPISKDCFCIGLTRKDVDNLTLQSSAWCVPYRGIMASKQCGPLVNRRASLA